MPASHDQTLPLPGEARYLKAGIASGRQLRDPQIVDRVSAMLLDIDRNGMDAVRRYSQELDGWGPETFRASREELDAASDGVDAGVRDRLEPGARRRPPGARGASGRASVWGASARSRSCSSARLTAWSVRSARA